MELGLAFIAIALPLALNLWATRLVARDDLCERRQKIAQLALVWLIPLVGAAVVLAVHRRAEPPSRRYREPPDPGDDYAMSARAREKLKDVLDASD